VSAWVESSTASPSDPAPAQRTARSVLHHSARPRHPEKLAGGSSAASLRPHQRSNRRLELAGLAWHLASVQAGECRPTHPEHRQHPTVYTVPSVSWHVSSMRGEVEVAPRIVTSGCRHRSRWQFAGRSLPSDVCSAVSPQQPPAGSGNFQCIPTTSPSSKKPATCQSS